MVIKIFDEPIRTKGGYLNNLNIDNIIEYRCEALMIIRQKYRDEDKWEYLIEHIEKGSIGGHDNCWIWDNDWHEGEEYVELLGWMEGLTSMSSNEIEKFYNILKIIGKEE